MKFSTLIMALFLAAPFFSERAQAQTMVSPCILVPDWYTVVFPQPFQLTAKTEGVHIEQLKSMPRSVMLASSDRPANERSHLTQRLRHLYQEKLFDLIASNQTQDPQQSRIPIEFGAPLENSIVEVNWLSFEMHAGMLQNVKNIGSTPFEFSEKEPTRGALLIPKMEKLKAGTNFSTQANADIVPMLAIISVKRSPLSPREDFTAFFIQRR